MIIANLQQRMLAQNGLNGLAAHLHVKIKDAERQNVSGMSRLSTWLLRQNPFHGMKNLPLPRNQPNASEAVRKKMNPPAMLKYTRENPSPRFLELQDMYKTMHTQGDPTIGLGAEQTFDGQSLMDFVLLLQNVFRSMGIRSVLDYGCGKAVVHKMARQTLQSGVVLQGTQSIWGVKAITLYDPGYEPYSAFPKGTFDAVICTDVLEHIPEEDIPWILEEIFSFAERFVFMTVALYPAAKSLPNGENAHITLKSVGWWSDLIEETAKRHPNKAYTVPLMYSWKGGRRVILNGQTG